LGSFELVDYLSHGGMGEGWRGVHRRRQHAVAVKLITREAMRKPTMLKAFRLEVEAVAQLHHPEPVR